MDHCCFLILKVVFNVLANFFVACTCLGDDEVKENDAGDVKYQNPDKPENNNFFLAHVADMVKVVVSNRHSHNIDDSCPELSNELVLSSSVLFFLKHFLVIVVGCKVLVSKYSENKRKHENDNHIKGHEVS